MEQDGIKSEQVDVVRRRLLKAGMYLPPVLLSLSLFPDRGLADTPALTSKK